ncbi:MAG: hypothetical protein ACXQT2_01440 [Methanotrichaceae archaeon]
MVNKIEIEDKETFTRAEVLTIITKQAEAALAEAEIANTDHVAALAELEQKIDERDATISAKDKELAGVVRAEVARAFKLPDSLAARLQGETKEELEADAAILAESMGPGGAVGGATNPAAADAAKQFTRAEIKGMSPAEIVANMGSIESQFKAGTLNR